MLGFKHIANLQMYIQWFAWSMAHREMRRARRVKVVAVGGVA